jgi:predicted ATPase/class 3 adenylate cyclase
MPSGTVTFLFTDIEGSTRLAQEYPDQWETLRKRHDVLLQSAMDAQNGYVFQVVGDAFCVAFSSGIDAVKAAMAAQELLFQEEWQPVQIRVRMGIHTGAAYIQDNGQYVGYTALATTQRIMSAGHGGQVLLSGSTCAIVREMLPQEISLLDLGEKRLKDLQRPERLYQLNAAGLRTSFPPLKTLGSPLNNLPVQLTTFIGREREIVEIKSLLENHRLVTLTGAGGSGKTRLSLQVAADLMDHFDHGVCLVELAPLANAELLSQAILSALGIREQAGVPPLEVLQEYLREKKLLIVLDNCEHLLEASARIANILLKTVKNLTILASSREALDIAGEVTYTVPPLSLPDIKRLPAAEQLLQYEAVRLFLDRALLVRPQFTVEPEVLPFIAEICHRLDGIPLAIELAAARVNILSMEQISSLLDDRFRLLTGGARTNLPRQQTLRALVDWSYDLLTEKERLLLRRLSTFIGGWRLEAAEEVCSSAGIESYEVLELLAQLHDKSLVVRVEQQQDRKTRFRMLETIRQYVVEKLQESGEDSLIHDRHFDYYWHTVERAKREFFSAKGLNWIVWLESEWDNLRAAVECSLEKHPDMGLSLVNALGYLVREARANNIIDMDRWLSLFVTHPANLSKTARRAEALLHWALYVGAAGQYDPAELSSIAQTLLAESLTVFEELGEKDGLAHAYLLQGDYAETPTASLSIYQKAVVLFRETGNQPGVARTLLHIGSNVVSLSYAIRISYLEEGLSIYHGLGYIPGIIETLKQIGAIEIQQGNFEQAHQRLDEAFSILQQHTPSLGNALTVAYDLGDLAFYEGNYDLAQKYYEDSLFWANENSLGSLVPGMWARVRLGYLYSRQGKWKEASRFFREVLLSFKSIEFVAGIVFTIEGLAGLAVAQRKYDKAACLFAWADVMREKFNDQRPPVQQAAVDKDLALIHARLDASNFAVRDTQGRIMTTEQMVDYAISTSL